MASGLAGAPVGQVAGGRDLEGAQHADVQVAAAHHGEAVGVVEEGAAGQQRHRLLAGVDEVVVFLPRAGAGPMPRMPFSLCSITSRSAGMWLATSVGWPMPRLTHGAVGDVLRHAGGELVLGAFGIAHGHAAFLKPPACVATRSIFTILLTKMPASRWPRGRARPAPRSRARWPSSAGGHGHDGAEVARRLAVGQVAPAVAALGLDQRHVAVNRLFQHVMLAVDLARFLVPLASSVP